MIQIGCKQRKKKSVFISNPVYSVAYYSVAIVQYFVPSLYHRLGEFFVMQSILRSAQAINFKTNLYLYVEEEAGLAWLRAANREANQLTNTTLLCTYKTLSLICTHYPSRYNEAVGIYEYKHREWVTLEAERKERLSEKCHQSRLDHLNLDSLAALAK